MVDEPSSLFSMEVKATVTEARECDIQDGAEERETS